jgi:hypothetical protein
MLGPLFAERALTIGKGKFNFNIGYAYVEFDDINGRVHNNSWQSGGESGTGSPIRLPGVF